MTETKINEVNNYFKLPIYYNEHKIELNQNIVNDSEFFKNKLLNRPTTNWHAGSAAGTRR
jgi:hypothetical protein